MQLSDKVVIVTGGANGIGKGLCERFHQEGAHKVVVADLEEANARIVAESIGGVTVWAYRPVLQQRGHSRPACQVCCSAERAIFSIPPRRPVC